MKINRFFSILLISVLFITNFLTVNASASESEELGLPEFPEITSEYVVLMDADSKEVLYSSNEHMRCYPASTTKLLTALLTLENCALDDDITFSQEAVDSIEYGDANASISPGETLTIEQALHCLLLRSANEVAYGLAEEVSGSVSAFASLMNSKVEAIGASDTHFTNASGLTDEFHYTTPYDMALIAAECFNSKELMKIAGYSGLYTIAPTNKSNFTRYYKPRYEMLEGGEYEYRYAVGGKTGYTDAARNCLVSFAQKDDVRLVCVIFKSTSADCYNDTAALFDYYLNNYHKIFIEEYDSGISGSGIDLLSLIDELDASSHSLGFKDGTYILVPNVVDEHDLATIITYSDSPAYVGEEGGFACVSFFYENINVGKATIYINSTSPNTNLPGTNGVVRHGQNNILISSNFLYVNIFVIIGIILLIGTAITIIIIVKKKNNRINYGSSRIRF